MTDDRLKEMEALVRGDEDVIFDTYVNRPRFGSKFWLNVTLVFFLIFFAALYKFAVLDSIIPNDVLVSSLEVFEVDSQWLVKEEVKETDFNGVIMVPQISFRFRNIGKIDLEYVSVMAVFRVPNRSRTLGEASELVMKVPVKPGTESGTITLTCSYGYKTTSKKAFSLNDGEWRDTAAEIYVKCGGSSFTHIKQYIVNRRIEGLDRKVKYHLVD